MGRRWFQIHLSTAVALMVVAGVLFWLNITVHYDYWDQKYGWPEALFYRDYKLNAAGPLMLLPFSFKNWFINISVTALILGATALVSECVHRFGTRRWLQIHLSTSVVLMLALGWVVNLNVTPQLEHLDDLLKIDLRIKMTDEHYGWPYEVARIRRYYGPSDFTIDTPTASARFYVTGNEFRHDIEYKPSKVNRAGQLHEPVFCVINTPIWESGNVFSNAVACLGSLAFLVFALESTIRRRDLKSRGIRPNGANYVTI